MKLLSSKQELWDKEIYVRLTLRELQELYCAFGNTSLRDRQKEWVECSSSTCPFEDSRCGDKLYKDMGQILQEQGGRTF